MLHQSKYERKSHNKPEMKVPGYRPSPITYPHLRPSTFKRSQDKWCTWAATRSESSSVYTPWQKNHRSPLYFDDFPVSTRAWNIPKVHTSARELVLIKPHDSPITFADCDWSARERRTCTQISRARHCPGRTVLYIYIPRDTAALASSICASVIHHQRTTWRSCAVSLWKMKDIYRGKTEFGEFEE